jgi:hypothetical protein
VILRYPTPGPQKHTPLPKTHTPLPNSQTFRSRRHGTWAGAAPPSASAPLGPITSTAPLSRPRLHPCTGTRLSCQRGLLPCLGVGVGGFSRRIYLATGRNERDRRLALSPLRTHVHIREILS